MIYSTCSLSVKQNEDVVRGFLQAHPDAALVPIDVRSNDVQCEVRTPIMMQILYRAF